MGHQDLVEGGVRGAQLMCCSLLAQRGQSLAEDLVVGLASGSRSRHPQVLNDSAVARLSVRRLTCWNDRSRGATCSYSDSVNWTHRLRIPVERMAQLRGLEGHFGDGDAAARRVACRGAGVHRPPQDLANPCHHRRAIH